MSDGEKPGGIGAGKVVLIVLAVLGGLCVVCSAGAWMLGGRYAWDMYQCSSAMTAAVQSAEGEKAAAALFPDDEGRMVLALVLPDEPADDRVTALQDAVWKAYATAFAKGGLDVDVVGVGRAAPSKAGITGWKSRSVPADEVAARTGVPAPPRAEWLDKLETDQLTIRVDTDEVKVETPGGDK
jgi:hypothetical protein